MSDGHVFFPVKAEIEEKKIAEISTGNTPDISTPNIGPGNGLILDPILGYLSEAWGARVHVPGSHTRRKRKAETLSFHMSPSTAS